MDKNNIMKTQEAEAVTMLESDNNKNDDLMSKYAKQISREIEDHGEYREV